MVILEPAAWVTEAAEETLDLNSFHGVRLPGLNLNSYANNAAPEHEQYCNNVWTKCGTDNNYVGATSSVEETFAAYVEEMNRRGVEECVRICQTLYDRYNSK